MARRSAKSAQAAARSQAPTAAERAYDWIRSAILSGEVPEGAFLDEQHVAAEIGTSRTPVREALQRLHTDRFIDLLPRRGAQVRVITAQEMQEVYDTRFIIEAYVIRQLCESKAEVSQTAHEFISKMEKARHEQDWVAVAQLDQAFHSTLVSQIGNNVLTDLYDSLRPRQVRLSIRTMGAALNRLDTIMSEHRRIVEAIDKSDVEAGITTLRAHLKQVPEVVRALA